VRVDEQRNTLIVNGNIIQLIYSDAPDKVDYTKYDIHNAVVVDNTGIWRDRKGLSRHLRAPGCTTVLLTAPAKGDVPNIVMGVNADEYMNDSENIFSAASCSTNAVTPVIQLIDQKYGLVSGHIETVHSFTNDQNLIDNYHSKKRRGRSAVLNMVLTETGAGKAVTKCLPHLKGKLTANAVRVPTPNVSMALLVLNLKKGTTKEEVNRYLQLNATQGQLQHQLDFSTSTEAVSSDFVGTRAPAIVDGPSSLVSTNGKVLNLYIWYDNENGYSCQVIRLLEKICGIVHPVCPVATESANPTPVLKAKL